MTDREIVLHIGNELGLECFFIDRFDIKARHALKGIRGVRATCEDGRVARLKFSEGDLPYLPEKIGELSKLKFLTLSNSPMTHLPVSIGNLSNLECLVLEGTNISELPESFGNLTALKRLYLNEMKKLTSLPESFGNLGALEELVAWESALEALPESFGNLSSLKWLSLCGSKVKVLPASFVQLPALSRIDIHSAHIVKMLDKMEKRPSIDLEIVLQRRENNSFFDKDAAWQFFIFCEDVRAFFKEIGELGDVRIGTCCDDLVTFYVGFDEKNDDGKIVKLFHFIIHYIDPCTPRYYTECADNWFWNPEFKANVMSNKKENGICHFDIRVKKNISFMRFCVVGC